ncbi:MAG: PASTA domain-containing protein, partial [Candidatus Eremiobacterota bacterium]
EVPNLYGLTPERAQYLLREAGLTWEYEGVAEDRRYPPGTVVSQRPGPGVVPLPQGVVRLRINKGDLGDVVRRRRGERDE